MWIGNAFKGGSSGISPFNVKMFILYNVVYIHSTHTGGGEMLNFF